MIAELRSPHVVVLHDYAVTETRRALFGDGTIGREAAVT